MKTSAIQTPRDSCINGIDLDVLHQTVQAIQQDSDLGACQFRASNRWIDGAHNASTISGFYGAGQEFNHSQTYVLHADEPPILAGRDQGANPVEHLLNALAACVTTSMVAHAAVRGIPIRSVESTLEGDLDLRGFLGLDASVPKGFTDIRVTFTVDAEPEHREVLEQLTGFSPVLNTLTQGVNVSIQVGLK